MSDHIRPEVQALINRGNITLEEWKNFWGNSWEFEAIVPALTDEALEFFVKQVLEQCTSGRSPAITYNELLSDVLAPELLKRLALRAG